MKYDIAIIGAGPGGYTAAIRAAQLGAKVVIIEKENPGGVCLNCGCIPTKTILAGITRLNEVKKFAKFGIELEFQGFKYEKLFEKKEITVEKLRKSLVQLIKSWNIDIISGEASIISSEKLEVFSKEESLEIEFNYLIMATGSKPAALPGLQADHSFILDTNDILALKELPESVLIVGSGANGVEWARIFEGAGKKVFLTEIAAVLMPMMDISQSERLERLFKRSKIEYFTSTGIENITDKKVKLTNGRVIEPDIIFLGAGREPNTNIKGLKELNIELKGKYIEIDNNLKTNIDNVYAIGDVTGKLQLAHVAAHQGIKAVEHILKKKEANIDYNIIPRVIYGEPKICSVGYTENQLIEKKIPFKKSIFPMSAVGKAFVEDKTEGFVKVLAYENKILGVHLIASGGDSIIQQAAVAMSSNITVEEFKETVFAHPSNSEALYEAFLGIDGQPINLPPERIKI